MTWQNKSVFLKEGFSNEPTPYVRRLARAYAAYQMPKRIRKTMAKTLNANVIRIISSVRFPLASAADRKILRFAHNLTWKHGKLHDAQTHN